MYLDNNKGLVIALRKRLELQDMKTTGLIRKV